MKENPKGLDPSSSDTTGNDASGQDGSGNDANPSTDGPHSPEPGGDNPPSGSNDTPGNPNDNPSTDPAKPSTPDTSSPSTGDTSGSGGNSSGSSDSGNSPDESQKPQKPQLSRKLKVLINSGLGAAGAAINDCLHKDCHPKAVLKDAAIAAATDSIGGFGNKLISTITYDAAGSLADSVIDQRVDQGWSNISIGQVAFNTAVGGELGVVGNISKLVSSLTDMLGEGIAYNLAYVLGGLGSSACNNYRSEA